MQPGRRHGRDAAHLSSRRREPRERRCAVDVATRAGGARAHPRSGERRASRRGDRGGGDADVQPRRHLRSSRRVGRRLAAHGGGGAGVRSAARVGLRLDRRGGHGAGRRSRSAIPTTTIRPTSTNSPTNCSRRPVSRTTKCRTGRGRATSRATTSSTGDRPTTAGSGVRHTRITTGGAGGTCGHPIATSI